ncbi:hypothetical protein B4065_1908 [Caldibacillus thermoamylovorans]|nr:hypothetical protein B4065_1908 [Caldibacillus thermoamylovorans]
MSLPIFPNDVKQLLHHFRINHQIIIHDSHKVKSPTCILVGDFT